MVLKSTPRQACVTCVLRGAQTPMYGNNRMKMLYTAWYSSPKRGLTSESTSTIAADTADAVAPRPLADRQQQSTQSNHPTTIRGPSARWLPPKVEAVNSLHLVTSSSSRQWASTLHVYGCAAILCHVKYLKVGRSSLPCFVFSPHTFSFET